jgi:hypothetical protein
VVPLLSNLASLEHQYVVSISDGWKSVSNYDACYISKLILHLIYRSLHLGLILFVKSGCSFVKDQKFWILNEGPSKGNSLLLSSWKLAALSSNVGVNSFRISTDKWPGICFF